MFAYHYRVWIEFTEQIVLSQVRDNGDDLHGRVNADLNKPFGRQRERERTVGGRALEAKLQYVEQERPRDQ